MYEKYNEWKEKLPRVVPFYAVKCNNDKVILKLLASLGCNFDCASKNEIQNVLDLGILPERIIFANPCKDRNYLLFVNFVDSQFFYF